MDKENNAQEMSSEQFHYILARYLISLRIEKILSDMPKRNWYTSDSEFFRFLEERNRSLNEAISEINILSGRHILTCLRVHKMNAAQQFYKIGDFLQDYIKSHHLRAVG